MHILKFRPLLCASSSSSASEHSPGRPRATGLQCSTLHSFSSTPTHSTFFSLDCAPLCPIYCFTMPAVLPPKPNSHFVSSLLFVSNCFQTLPLLSRSLCTDFPLEHRSTFLSSQSSFKQHFRAGNALPCLKRCVSNDSARMHTKHHLHLSWFLTMTANVCMQTEEAEELFKCFFK